MFLQYLNSSESKSDFCKRRKRKNVLFLDLRRAADICPGLMSGTKMV